MIVLAIDPGGVTGLAWGAGPDGLIYTATTPLVKEVFWAIKGYPPEQYSLLPYLRPEVVILEQYQTAQRLNPHARHTIELIGGVKAACFLEGIKLVMRAPKDRIPALPDAKRVLDATDAIWMVHEQDALAHLLAYEKVIAQDHETALALR